MYVPTSADLARNAVERKRKEMKYKILVIVAIFNNNNIISLTVLMKCSFKC